MRKGITYRDAGVDTKEGARAVSLMKQHAEKTFDAHVLKGLGSFGSMFRLDTAGMTDPILISGTDGVGTKLNIAFLLDRHDTVGRDCVAMCVNDILCHGARPLFFLDYIATGKVVAERIEQIVKGVSDGCLAAGCSLVGGETAEMPGFYADGEYDIAGFAVGVVDRSRLIDGSGITAGDLLIGVPSSGLHSNGYSLAREIFFQRQGWDIKAVVDVLGMTLGEALLAPTRIYRDVCEIAGSACTVKGIAHITGGGFFENIPRILPPGLGAKIKKGSWKTTPLFDLLRDLGGLEEEELYGTFNMGIGLVMAVSATDAPHLIRTLAASGEEAFLIGNVVEGSGVTLVE